MAFLDERVQLLISALQRGGATGIASEILSSIEQAESPDDTADLAGDDDDEGEPVAPVPVEDEGDGARGLRQLRIANLVVEGLLDREIDLVPAIRKELSALRKGAERSESVFRVEDVVVASTARSAGTQHGLASQQRLVALKNLLTAWKAAWGPAFEGSWRDLR